MKIILLCMSAAALLAYSPLSAAPPSDFAIACANADTADVRKLISPKTVNVGDDTGQTPLHYAVSNFRPDKEKEYLQVISLLIANGANVYARNSSNQTPLSIVKARLKMTEYKRYNYNQVLKIIYPEVPPTEVTSKKSVEK